MRLLGSWEGDILHMQRICIVVARDWTIVVCLQRWLFDNSYHLSIWILLPWRSAAQFSLNLSWPCDILWSIECYGSGVVYLRSWIFKRPGSFCLCSFGMLLLNKPSSRLLNDTRLQRKRGPVVPVPLLSLAPSQLCWLQQNDLKNSD